MDSRRNFLKKAMVLSGTAGLANIIPPSIQRAVAINPPPGSTYMDAEHVVILMQENRSFDHTFGTLRGVRGYNDPRAISQPNGNLVWMQSNEKGETYVPFHFDIKNTKATWMGSVPHSRSSQIDANNYGKYDNWLQAKRVRDKKYADMPLTLGYYTREDIPFTYALADAFTVCDQHFCSVMSSTDPNRIFFWTGTIRKEQNGTSKPKIRNEFPGLGKLDWDTFPERLQDNGISWKVYQNDIEAGGGFTGEQRAWLANFGCNPLEWFANYNVQFSARYVQGLQKQVENLPGQVKALEDKIQSLSVNTDAYVKAVTALSKKKEVLKEAQNELSTWNQESYDKLTQNEKELYQRAFTINKGDPHYHDLTTLSYQENGEERSLMIPKGDVLYQFRHDVETGQLPVVSWLVAPWNLIDHPSAPWYGSLYVSEILDILTANPEIWKKTIFILTFDENDGYFDHIPPFTTPDPLNPETGKCSRGLDTAVEYVYKEDELKDGVNPRIARQGSIGLGFRVPLVIASPWSRGGRVCSQVFDHTSTLQFLEGFLSKKFGRTIRETNVSQWRRTICGDLTSVFMPYRGEQVPQLPFLKKDPFIETIYNAKFKEAPDDFGPLSSELIAAVNKAPLRSPVLPKQEPGIKPTCAVRYQLYAEGKLVNEKKEYSIALTASENIFGKKSLGSGFIIYFSGKNRSYTVTAGDTLEDTWLLKDFDQENYHFSVHGPNGFFREFTGNKNDPLLGITCEYEESKGLVRRLTGNVIVKLVSLSPLHAYTIEIVDNAYKNKPLKQTMTKGKGSEHFIILNLDKSHSWYDFTVRVTGFNHFEKRYAGHVETGNDSFTDPAMGGLYL